ncbi:MAG: CpsD/CapB family tyrosine-protein kinase [Elusimicrobia bacterium]|nr:CpsD/CapB family tyrosine-protein kinase [Elusimicrobiota bacterium]
MNPYLLTMLGKDPFILDQYRNLCTKIIWTCAVSDKRCLLITSSVASEGKSLTSLNLAISIAEMKKEQVILVDGDLRHPSLHKFLDIQPEHGLLSYFQNEAGYFGKEDDIFSKIVYPSGIDNISLIPVEKSVSNPAEVLTSGKMPDLIRELKQRYKNGYIIIDSPPVVPISDAIILSHYVDGVIFLVKAGGPPREVVHKAVALLENKKILGVILNNINLVSYEYPYGYKSYHYK